MITEPNEALLLRRNLISEKAIPNNSYCNMSVDYESHDKEGLRKIWNFSGWRFMSWTVKYKLRTTMNRVEFMHRTTQCWQNAETQSVLINNKQTGTARITLTLRRVPNHCWRGGAVSITDLSVCVRARAGECRCRFACVRVGGCECGYTGAGE